MEIAATVPKPEKPSRFHGQVARILTHIYSWPAVWFRLYPRPVVAHDQRKKDGPE